MSEQISRITKETLVPISLVLSIIMGTWFLSAMNSRIAQTEGLITELKRQCQDNPNRSEFNQLRADINEIKGDVKTLITAK